MERKFVMASLGYALLGLTLGLYMGLSQNHSELVTHAHIMLVGFVVNFIYAVLHKLWLGGIAGKLPKVQFFIHQIGTVLMVVGLFLLYGHFVDEAIIGPVLGFGSLLVLIGMVMMKIMYIKTCRMTQAQ